MDRARGELQALTVSDDRVERDLGRGIRENFPHGGFRQFLRRTGQTRDDLRWRIRINLLSSALSRRAAGDAKTVAGRQRRIDRFILEFRERWRAQTFCTPRFLDLADRCANAPA